MTGPLALKLFTIFQVEQSNVISEVWELDAIPLNLPYDLAQNGIVQLAWCSLNLLLLGYVGYVAEPGVWDRWSVTFCFS